MPTSPGRATAGSERLIGLALMASAVLTVVVGAVLLATLLVQSARFFADVAPGQLIGSVAWSPLSRAPQFGLWPLLSGTLLTSVIGVAIAVPLGVLAAVYIAELAPERVRALLEPSLSLLAGVPGVVFGYLALAVVTPALARALALQSHNALAAGLVIGLMLVPLVATLSAAAIRRVPEQLRLASYALGVSRTTTIFRVVLPAARHGVAAAALFAAARAAGETMIVAIAAGHSAQLSFDPRGPVETLTTTALRLSTTAGARSDTALHAAYVAGAVLIAITLLINVAAQRASSRRLGPAPGVWR